MQRHWLRPAVGAAASLFIVGLATPVAPTAGATICGSVGGRFVDVTGCSDPFHELNDALQPPPPPGYVPPPPPPPNVTVCANVGRRISVSGCV
jgi:hypothetical protein